MDAVRSTLESADQSAWSTAEECPGVHRHAMRYDPASPASPASPAAHRYTTTAPDWSPAASSAPSGEYDRHPAAAQ